MLDQGEPRVGMRWRDLTGPGFRPEMEITELVPYRVWAETGTWRGRHRRPALRFTAVGAGTRVAAEVEIDLGGSLARGLGRRTPPRAGRARARPGEGQRGADVRAGRLTRLVQSGFLPDARRTVRR